MNLKIENWKLLVLSIFYVILAILSFQITTEQFHNFFFVSGIVVAVFGLLQICAYFFKKDYLKPNEFSFSFGVMYLLVGAVIACKPYLIVDNYPIVVSVVIVWDSALRLQYAMNLLRLQKKWILTLFLALIPMALGMVLLMCELQPDVKMTLFRILLVVDAIANFFTIIAYKIKVKDYDTQESDQILDIATRETPIATGRTKNEIMKK